MSSTGGKAFPRPASEFTASGTLADGNDAIEPQDGMSLLDYYIGQALAGLLANPARIDTPKRAAERAVECGLAVIAARREMEILP